MDFAAGFDGEGAVAVELQFNEPVRVFRQFLHEDGHHRPYKRGYHLGTFPLDCFRDDPWTHGLDIVTTEANSSSGVHTASTQFFPGLSCQTREYILPDMVLPLI